MSARAELIELRQRGVKVEIDGDDLVVTGADRLGYSEIERPRSIKRELVALLRADADGRSAADWLANFEERAGIAECDGGLPSPEAEARAHACCVGE